MTSSSVHTPFIRADERNSEYVTWSAPLVEEDAVTVSRGQPNEQADLDLLHQQARDEGFTEGRTAGLAAGQQELTEITAALECVFGSLARPLEELDVRVEEEIVALVKAVSRQLVRREFKLDPSHIVGVIREGLAALPLSSDAPVIRLHPQDADIVQQRLSTSDADRAWRIEADPVLQRGGCVIGTAESQIDCRLETRLGRVIATMFEGERADDK